MWDNIKVWFGLLLMIALFVGSYAFMIIYKQWILLTFVTLILGLPIFLFVGMFLGLDAGFRNKFPLDYLAHLNTEIDYFTSLGYQISNYIEPGGERPGVTMIKDNSPSIIILLNAPLSNKTFSVDVYSSDAPEAIKAHYDITDPDVVKIHKLACVFSNQVKA